MHLKCYINKLCFDLIINNECKEIAFKNRPKFLIVKYLKHKNHVSICHEFETTGVRFPLNGFECVNMAFPLAAQSEATLHSRALKMFSV